MMLCASARIQGTKAFFGLIQCLLLHNIFIIKLGFIIPTTSFGLHSWGSGNPKLQEIMACALLKLTTILSLIIPLLLLALQSHLAFSNDIEDNEDIEYVVDSPLPNLRSRSRFLASTVIIKKGAHCDAISHNICNGIRATKGKALLYCCKKHCRNVLGDKNNCGSCGKKCKQGERCCDGKCAHISSNVNHCGKCNKKCAHGVKCEYGYCGYA